MLKGYCNKHYQKLVKYGDALYCLKAPDGEPHKYLLDSIKTDTNECIEWKYGGHEFGYGGIRINGKDKLVHRYAMELKGFDTDGYVVRHSCDNPKCFNPRHLSLGSHQDNSNDAKDRNRVRRGSRHGIAKLHEQDVRDIRLFLKNGFRPFQIAKLYPVTRMTISDIRNGKSWGWLN